MSVLFFCTWLLLLFICDVHSLFSLNDTNSKCWYLVTQKAIPEVLTPPNVCYGKGKGSERTESQIAKIMDSDSIQMQFFVNGNCSGQWIVADWFNKSDGYSMYADLKRGRDCGFVTRIYPCEDNKCSKCDESGTFLETAGVSGVCSNADDGTNNVESCTLDKYTEQDAYNMDDTTCKGDVVTSTMMNDGCHEITEQYAFWYTTVYCQNYK